ncbi:NUDIX hydrolase [Nonomuraea soli]|uniref:8-oxo-dGTP pyrophosphatase MutT (NUDIX family) n=1 Tax=Nonomuraea soli TaxID=1032476 RepID=A0A7W0HQ88_9ACTN|nr:NUDIX hydrolase [Nonomuraea soli]MBA2891653.1 8-oxo-dGTP pyrophosphatase MutT (NUDIX family) [Nonomuraea soli]
MAASDGDGWATCAQGHTHWGVHGASGLLVVHHDAAGVPYILMQKRALWSHHGGTWGLPGGARDSHEDPIATAMREAREEAALDKHDLRVSGVYLDDHGGWTFDTVIAESGGLIDARPANAESTALRWVPLGEVTGKRLHPGFAHTWVTIQDVLAPQTLVLDVANIVGARAEHGWWRDRAGAASRLLTEVAAARLRHPVLDQWFPRIVAVVEGAARGVEPVPGVEVVAAQASGDDTIVDVVRGVPGWQGVTVVTADRGLRDRVSDRARTEGPKWLINQL